MEVQQLQVFAKFVFISENSNYCISTTDINVLKNIKDPSTNLPLMDIEKGYQLNFEQHGQKGVFEITEVSVKTVTDNLEVHQYGFSTEEDCGNILGVEKEFLFVVWVKIKLIS